MAQQPLLAIDFGNTRAKLGWFTGAGAPEVAAYQYDALDTRKILQKTEELGIEQVAYASVAHKLQPSIHTLLVALGSLHQTELQVSQPSYLSNDYGTPETLGVDRWIAIHGARALTVKGRLLSIDLGTAITYDYLAADNRYLGGAIAPGIDLRYRALHNYTARLPLVEKGTGLPELIGSSTASSMASGVENGILFELEGAIAAYERLEKDDLTVFLTGGDAPRFENHVKRQIFANQSLVLLGIQALLTYQLHGETPLTS